MSEVRDLPMGEVKIEWNDRTTYPERELAELAISIRENGLVCPVVVRPAPDGGYRLVAGHRRFLAHQKLEAPTIRAIVDDLDDQKAAAVKFVENVNRAALNPLEEGQAIRVRLDHYGETLETLSRQTGKTASYLEARLALLKLIPEAAHLVASGQMGPALGAAMAPLDANRQLLALKAFGADPQIDQANFRAICSRLLAEQQQDNFFDPDSFLNVEEFVVETLKENRRYRRNELVKLIGKLMAAVEFDARRDPDLAKLVDEAKAVLRYEPTTKGKAA